jgi:hypothetical protein
MNLDSARDLKQRIREVAARSHDEDARSPFAIGIGLTSRPDDYTVAVLPASRPGMRFLDAPAMRRLIGEGGKELDIEMVVPAAARPASGGVAIPRQPVLMIGASVGHFSGGDGTLGFFAVRRRDKKCGFVSCNHVIAGGDRGVEGDDVLSPPPMDGGRRPKDCVATLDGTYPTLVAPRRSVADCAFASLLEGVPFDPGSVGGGTLVATPAVIKKRIKVTKVGRRTPPRPGTVGRIEIDNFSVRYGSIKAYFDDVIEIESSTPARFAEGGDSGALVYTASTLQPVGLLFAVSAAGGRHNAGWSWAHPISRVTSALDVDIVVS